MVLHVMVAVLDEPQRKRLLRVLREDKDVVAIPVESLDQLWAGLKRQNVDLILIGQKLLPDDARSFVHLVRELPDHSEVVVVGTDDRRPDQKARLLAAGCMAVLSRDLKPQVLREVVPTLLERRRNDEIIRIQADRPEEQYSLNDFVSASPAMTKFLATARRLVHADSSLLILGETGTGKERLARAIHRSGPRRSGPFLAVNCGALPEGLLESELFGHEEGAFTGATRARKGFFELAHRGTLFLDEVGEMPHHLQVKLLRALEEGRIRRLGGEKSIEVNARMVAATNRDLEAEMRAGRFRPDLFFRLAVVTLRVPPLKDRKEDIPTLARSYLEHFRVQTGRPARGFSEAALEILSRYHWPGNVRELINAVERATLLSDGPVIGVAHLPQRITAAALGETGQDRPSSGVGRFGLVGVSLDRGFSDARREFVDAFERAYLSELLRETKGRIGVAAQRAGISQRSLYAHLKRHGLRKEAFKGASRNGDSRPDSPGGEQ